MPERTRKERMEDEARKEIAGWTDDPRVAQTAFILWTQIPGRMFDDDGPATPTGMARFVENNPEKAFSLIEQAKQEGIIS